MNYLIWGVFYIIVVLGLAYGGFLFERWFHWEFYYGPQTQKMICETVRPEAIATGICGKE